MNFNKLGIKPYVPTASVNKLVASGAKGTILQIKCWKCSRTHYARDCKNKTSGVLHKLQEEPIVEDIVGTPRIYTALVG